MMDIKGEPAKKLAMALFVSLLAAHQPSTPAARFGARCAIDSELVGHPVPGYANSSAGILNEYPIGVRVDGSFMKLGYIYTTVGRRAYFVPTDESYRDGLVKLPGGSSIVVGSNADVASSTHLSSKVAAKLKRVLRAGVAPVFYRRPIDGVACFSRDWDGRVPKR